MRRKAQTGQWVQFLEEIREVKIPNPNKGQGSYKDKILLTTYIANLQKEGKKATEDPLVMRYYKRFEEKEKDELDMTSSKNKKVLGKMLKILQNPSFMDKVMMKVKERLGEEGDSPEKLENLKKKAEDLIKQYQGKIKQTLGESEELTEKDKEPEEKPKEVDRQEKGPDRIPAKIKIVSPKKKRGRPRKPRIHWQNESLKD